MEEKIICQICKKKFKRITNTHLKKNHNTTMAQYRQEFPDAPIDMDGLAYSRVAHLRDKSYDEVYGPDKAETLKKTRKKDALRQMQNPDQIKVRQEKSGYEFTVEQKKYLSELRTTHGANNYRVRALEHYGDHCQRCGDKFNLKKLVVHHKDFLNIHSELGNHELENLVVLCKSCHAKLHNELSKVAGKFSGISNIEKGVHFILKGLNDEFGLDLKDENFKDTPKRVARAYYEIFEGVKNTKEQVKEILDSSFPSDLNEMIISKNIHVYSMCPHHLLPVEYNISVGYIPHGKVLGISKLSRLVEVLAKRPVLQETLTHEIVDYLNMSLGVVGAICEVEGVHFCMKMRGIKQQNSKMITSAISGVFKDKNNGARAEFLQLINL